MSLDIIRQATKNQLRDRAWLEDAILRLGIYPAQEIPPGLWQQDGHGLGICQLPEEFAPYLIEISKKQIRSYAEIGVWMGGAFITTIEYLRRFGLERALAIDPDIKPAVREYVEQNEDVGMLALPSQAPEVKEALAGFKPDLLLIDGDHGEEAARADWELARHCAKWVSFHDTQWDGVAPVFQPIELPKQEWVTNSKSHGTGLVKVA